MNTGDSDALALKPGDGQGVTINAGDPDGVDVEDAVAVGHRDIRNSGVPVADTEIDIVRDRVALRETDRDRVTDGDTEDDVDPEALLLGEAVAETLTEALWLREDDADAETDADPVGVGDTDGSSSYRCTVRRYVVRSKLQPTIGSSTSSADVRFHTISASSWTVKPEGPYCRTTTPLRRTHT